MSRPFPFTHKKNLTLPPQYCKQSAILRGFSTRLWRFWDLDISIIGIRFIADLLYNLLADFLHFNIKLLNYYIYIVYYVLIITVCRPQVHKTINAPLILKVCDLIFFYLGKTHNRLFSRLFREALNIFDL